MAFNDSQNDLKSLLALLKSTQDGSHPAPSSGASTLWQHQPAQPQRPPLQASGSSGSQGYGTSSVIPTQRQLDDLLASLNNPQSAQSSSAFSGPRRDLIQPFGPIRHNATASSSKQPFDPQHLPLAHAEAEAVQVTSDIYGQSGIQRFGKRRDEPGYGDMGFTKALPIISELLGDDGFKKELKKMKHDQDTLERRLWAKQERVKVDHDKAIQPEKEIARISRKPIPTDRQVQWKTELNDKLSTFYKSCLPIMDGLALRQKDRLEELGVPGLAGDLADDKVRIRVKRILDLLQASLEEE